MGMVDYLIEERAPLDPEIDEIIALINRVWLEEYRDIGFFHFDRQVFDWYARGSLKYGWCYMAREAGSGKLIGFGIGMPRHVTVHGQGPWLLGYGSLITVDPAYRRQGVAKAIWERAWTTGKRLGIKGALATIEEGSNGLKTVQQPVLDHLVPLWTHHHAYIRPLALRAFARYLNMRWYERIAVQLLQRVAPVSDPRIRAVSSTDYPRLLPLMNRYAQQLDLARVWDTGELADYYQNPIIRSRVLQEDGELRALVNAAVVPFSIKGHTRRIALLENLHYDDVPYADQRLLIRALLHDLKGQDVAFAGEFGMGYNSPRAIRSNRFLKYDRRMTLYFLPIADPDDPVVSTMKGHCAATYIDVR